MASKHLLRDEKFSRRHLVAIAALAVLAVTALSAAMMAHLVTGNAVAVQSPAAAPAVQQPISQEGRLVAVSPTSVTAESIDGYARTYLIDSQTNAITTRGSSIGGAANAFAVNDEVAIVGVVRDGRAVATAVAAKQVSNLDGPPMDGLDNQVMPGVG